MAKALRLPGLIRHKVLSRVFEASIKGWFVLDTFLSLLLHADLVNVHPLEGTRNAVYWRNTTIPLPCIAPFGPLITCVQ